MRLIYMDEAGIGDPRHEPFLVVAGLLVNADRHAKHLEAALARVREKHCPDAPKDFVFHTTHIFSGESGHRYFARERWPKEKRWAILDDLARIPKEYDIPIVHGHIERAPLLEIEVEKGPIVSARDRMLVQYSVCFFLCTTRADWWLRHHAPSREVGMAIAEDNRDVRESLRRMHSFAQRPDNTAALLPGWETYLPFRKIIDTVHYAEKQRSALLQLADLCAFVIKRQLMGLSRPVSERGRFYDSLQSQHYQPDLKALKRPESPS